MGIKKDQLALFLSGSVTGSTIIVSSSANLSKFGALTFELSSSYPVLQTVMGPVPAGKIRRIRGSSYESTSIIFNADVIAHGWIFAIGDELILKGVPPIGSQGSIGGTLPVNKGCGAINNIDLVLNPGETLKMALSEAVNTNPVVVNLGYDEQDMSECDFSGTVNFVITGSGPTTLISPIQAGKIALLNTDLGVMGALNYNFSFVNTDAVDHPFHVQIRHGGNVYKISSGTTGIGPTVFKLFDTSSFAPSRGTLNPGDSLEFTLDDAVDPIVPISGTFSYRVFNAVATVS